MPVYLHALSLRHYRGIGPKIQFFSPRKRGEGAQRLAALTRLEGNVAGSAASYRGLALGFAGSFFTLSEMMLVSCITC